MFQTSALLGETIRLSFGTADGSGAAIAADSTPVVVVLEQGVTMSYQPTVSSVQTGLYEVAIVCSVANGFDEGKEYSCYVTTVIGGVTGRDGLASFRVGAGNLTVGDTVRVCFGTASALGAAANADSTPTATAIEQGSVMGYSPPVTNIATGLYEVAVVCSAANGFESNKEYDISVAAVLGGLTVRDGVLSFRIPATYPDQSNAVTLSTIRDRIHVLVEALTPNALAGTKFRRYRNEGGGDFSSFALANPQGALRRFQARDSGQDDVVEVSNSDNDLRHVTFEIQVAYPSTARYGADQAMDRDDVIDQDFHQLDYALGIYGRSNFSSTNDCTPLGCSKDVVRGEVCDVLVIQMRCSYYRSSQ